MTTNSISTNRARYVQALLASTALVSVSVVEAQLQDTGGPAASRSEEIEEIVVRGVARRFRPENQSTATGLAMRLVETPQSVTVLSPEMLHAINANSAYEATDLVPNVQRSGSGFGNNQITIRGVFNGSRRINSILIDGTRIHGYGLDRLEIVRGPATAIYGVASNFGGEINQILKHSTAQRRMQFGAEVGSYDSLSVYFDVNSPLAADGSVSGRLVAKYDEYDLPLDIPGESFPNYESFGMGSVSWDVRDRTTLRFSFYHQNENKDPWDGGALILDPDGTLRLPDVDPEQWYFSQPHQSKQTLSADFGLIELEHEFGSGWTSSSKLGWYRYEEDIEYFYPFGPFGAYSLADDEIYIYSYDTESSGEQLTFNQSLHRDFEMFGRQHQIFGALEYANDLEPARGELLNSFFQGYASIDWFTEGIYDGQPRFSDGSVFEPIQGDREAAFGVRQEDFDEDTDVRLSLQLLVKPTDRLNLLLGIMHNDSESITTITRNRGVDIIPPEGTKVEFQKQVYRFGAVYDWLDDWRFIDDARVYYSFSEGYQPQTFTDADGNTIAAPQDMTQHELGLKTEIFGGAVGTSLALFDYEITNITAASSYLGEFGGFGSTVLSGRKEATGLEMELIGELLPGWNVVANYAYMDVVIVDPNNVFVRPPRTTPKNVAKITTTYEFLEGSLAGLRIGTSVKISSDYSFNEGRGIDRETLPLMGGAHERVDLTASYAPRSGILENVELYFHWRNVFDEDIIVSKQGHPGYGLMFIDQPSITVGMRYTFEE